MQGSTPKVFDFAAAENEFTRSCLGPFWKRRLLELAALSRLVGLECPKLSSGAHLENAYQLLSSVGPQGAIVLRSPAFLQWINVCRHLVMRNMHRSLPMGHVEDHLYDLGRFALAASCLKRKSFSARSRIQLDGRLSLPGVNLVLALGRDDAGRTVELETNGAEVTAVIGPRQFMTSLEDLRDHHTAAAGWRRLPWIARGIILDDSAEMSHAHHATNPSWKVRHCDPDYVSEWQSVGEEACGLVSLVEESLWVPVRALVSSILPLEAPNDVNLSGTTAEVLGCIAASLPSNPALLAETLVHEAAHTTLHILSDELKYWQPMDAGGRYRSPWRDDLRPISGMTHGIFAFLGVGEFWAGLLQRKTTQEYERLGRSRLKTTVLQIKEAIAEIIYSPELTDAGEELLAAAERKVNELCAVSDFYEPPSQEKNAIREKLANHRRELAPPPGRDQSSAFRFEGKWSSKLGLAMPPQINSRSLGVVRRESLSDAIQLAAKKNDAAVSEWVALLEVTNETEPESAALIRGSILYGQGDFAAAAASYSRYVECRWEDFDAWRLLSAALRRAGRFPDALAIAFALGEILQNHTPNEVRSRWGAEWPLHLNELVAHHESELSDGN